MGSEFRKAVRRRSKSTVGFLSQSGFASMRTIASGATVNLCNKYTLKQSVIAILNIEFDVPSLTPRLADREMSKSGPPRSK